jgi:hypothetical protein
MAYLLLLLFLFFIQISSVQAATVSIAGFEEIDHETAPAKSVYYSRANDSDRAPSIYATSWGVTLALDGTGFYNDMIHLIMEDMGKGADYRPTPYSRAKAIFLEKGEGCLYPSSTRVLLNGNEIQNAADFVETKSFLTVRVHILAGKGRPVYQKGLDIKDKIIAHSRGSAIATIMRDSGAYFLPVSDEIHKARLMISDRIDYMLASLPDTAFVFRDLGEPLPPFDPESEIFSGGVGVVCHKNPKTEALVKQLNDAYLHHLRNGNLAKLFENTSLEAGDYLPLIE